MEKIEENCTPRVEYRIRALPLPDETVVQRVELGKKGLAD